MLLLATTNKRRISGINICLLYYSNLIVFYFILYKIKILLYPNLNLYVCETPFRKLELRLLTPTPPQALIKFITSTVLLIKFITSYQLNYNNKIIEHVSI